MLVWNGSRSRLAMMFSVSKIWIILFLWLWDWIAQLQVSVVVAELRGVSWGPIYTLQFLLPARYLLNVDVLINYILNIKYNKILRRQGSDLLPLQLQDYLFAKIWTINYIILVSKLLYLHDFSFLNSNLVLNKKKNIF